jgi:hypothetical protein
MDYTFIRSAAVGTVASLPVTFTHALSREEVSMAMTIKSTVFEHNDDIPARYNL